MVGWGLPGNRGTQPGLSRDGKGRLEETADTQAHAVMGGGNRDHVFLLTASSEAERVSPSCPHAGAISSLSYPGWTVRNAETQRGEHAAMLQVHATNQGYACAALASISGFQTCSLHAETVIPREQDCRSLSVWAAHWLPGRWGERATLSGCAALLPPPATQGVGERQHPSVFVQSGQCAGQGQREPPVSRPQAQQQQPLGTQWVTVTGERISTLCC